MAKRRHLQSSGTVEELRLAIECLPVSTRHAMLAGVRGADPIITGAYVDGHGGMCPMLAAHRNGASTSFLSFARSWDRFTRVGRKVRRASAMELEILVNQLQASLMGEECDLERAIREHRTLVTRRRALAADPAGEIVARRLARRDLVGARARCRGG